jgi:glucose dehydrogenase
MLRTLLPCSALSLAFLCGNALAQTPAEKLLHGVAEAPVTDAMLRNPDAADWLQYSRTYDVGSLQRAWSKPLAAGPLEIIPLVHRGVMYLVTPGSRDGGSRVVALNAATGDTLWEYVPPDSASSRIKALAIYADMIYYTAPARSSSKAR